MQDGQQLNMTIRKNGEKLVLSMIPDTSGVKDKAVSSLEPLVMNGTPQEFEEHIIDRFTVSIAKKNGARLELITLKVNSEPEDEKE